MKEDEWGAGVRAEEKPLLMSEIFLRGFREESGSKTK